MKMNISATAVIQLGILMALFCLCMVSAEGRPSLVERRSQGWTPQALFLYGIMGPRRQKDVSYNTMKRTPSWGPRRNIMRAWPSPRVSRAADGFNEIDDDDDDSKRAGWTGRSRVFGRAEDFDEKRVPEELLTAYKEFPLLKRMREIAEKRDSEQNRILEKLDEFQE